MTNLCTQKVLQQHELWPINLCHIKEDSHTPTCKLLESDGIKNIKVMDAKNFSQRFADFCKFSKTFLNYLFPLRYFRH